MNLIKYNYPGDGEDKRPCSECSEPSYLHVDGVTFNLAYCKEHDPKCRIMCEEWIHNALGEV